MFSTITFIFAIIGLIHVTLYLGLVLCVVINSIGFKFFGRRFF